MIISRKAIEHDLITDGIPQRVLYLGYLPVTVSIRELTPDMRPLLLKHSVNVLEQFSQDSIPSPPENPLISLMLGDATVINEQLDMIISAQFISLIRDDGSLLLRVPLKFTAIIDRIQDSNTIAFIAKRLDGSQRQCTVLKVDKTENAERMVQIMRHAIAICAEMETQKEPVRCAAEVASETRAAIPRLMDISREGIKNDLITVGIPQRAMCLGFLPVNVPVHEMTSEMRSLLLTHSIDTLQRLSQYKPPPPGNSLTTLVLGKPRLLKEHVDIIISSKFISLIRDDGSLILRVPLKFTSSFAKHGNCVAFIAKKLDDTGRRCTALKVDTNENAEKMIQIMCYAMEICCEEQASALQGKESCQSPIRLPVAEMPINPSLK